MIRSHTRYLLSCLIAAGVGTAAATSSPAAELGEKDEPIKLALNDWTGQHVTTLVAGQLLEKLGYKVEYVTAGMFPQFEGLADGALSATLEVWMNNVGEVFPKVLKAGQIVDMGPLGLETKQGWVYPHHMADLCPGLPDWTALQNPDCVKALATPDTYPNGRLLDYPADWGSQGTNIIADNDLQLTSIPAGSEGALVAELESANASKKPLLMMMWAPHYVLAEVPVDWVVMPPCRSEDEQHCIHPPEVHKIAWKDFATKWPAAFVFLQNYQMKAVDQQAMMLAIDKKGQDLEAVTKAWIDAHQTTWEPWIKAAGGS